MLTLGNFYGSSSTGGSLTWSVVSVDTTGANGNGYIFDNSSASHILTLPSTPPIGATIGYKDLNGYFASFPLTIDGVAEKINGFAEDMIVDSANAYGLLTYSGTANGWVLTNASVGPPVVGKPLLQVQDQKVSGTSGGTSINGTQTRTLTTIVQNDIAGASLGNNQITLPAGIYYLDISVPSGSDMASASKVRLYNITTSTYIAEGINTVRFGNCCLLGQFIFSNTTTLEVRFYTTAAVANGLGTPCTQGIEVYTDVKIWKLDSDRVYNPRVFQPINQAVSNAYVTGGIYGGELNYVSTTQFSVNAFSCMADDLATPLFVNSTTTVTITSPVLNTIYHAFAIKTNTGTYGIKTDTDINGANLGATVVAKRWLGFVRTNSSVQICKFIMADDTISFQVADECKYSTGLSSATLTPLDLSSVPTQRISTATLSFMSDSANSGNIELSTDGINGIWRASTINNTNAAADGRWAPTNPIPVSNGIWYKFVGTVYSTGHAIKDVKLRR